MQGAYTLNTPVASADNSLPIAVRDALLTGSNGGVRFLFDTAFGWCYPGGPLTGRAAAGAPANGAAIGDISEHANGSFALAAGQAVAYAGGGFDFSTLTAAGGSSDPLRLNHIKGPGSVWAGIQAAQQFAVMAYLKLPTALDWTTVTDIFPIFASSAGGYLGEADPLTLNFANGGLVQARRQTSIGVKDQLEVSAALHHGLNTQILFWRTATETGLRLKSTAGTTLITGAAGALNTADSSALQPRFGIPGPFTTFTFASHRTARNFRLYRGGIENLALSARAPAVAIGDADWTRVQARIAASAAANGGTSLIFV